MVKTKKLSLIIIVIVLVSIAYTIFMFKDEAKSFLIKTTQKEATSIMAPSDNTTSSTINSYVQEKKIIQNETSISQQRGIITRSPITIDTSEWLTYKNEKYGYEIKYPKNATISIEDNYKRVVIHIEKLLGISKEKIPQEKAYLLPEISLSIMVSPEVGVAYGSLNKEKGSNDNISMEEIKEWVYRYGPSSGRQAPQPLIAQEVEMNGYPAYYLDYSLSGEEMGVNGYARVFIIMSYYGPYIYRISAIKIPVEKVMPIEDPLLPYIQQYISISEAMIQSFRFMK